MDKIEIYIDELLEKSLADRRKKFEKRLATC